MYIYYIYTHTQEETRRDVFFFWGFNVVGKRVITRSRHCWKMMVGFFSPYFPRVKCCLNRVKVKDGGGETEVSQGKLG